MTDSSDCESDAGASPSVSSDESSSSSGSSSAATTVKITPVRQSASTSTPPKKSSPPGGSSTNTSLNTTVTPPSASTSTSSSLLLTPVSSGRKPLRKRQICTTSSSSMPPPSGGSSSSKASSKLRRGSQSDGNKASTSVPAPTNKRKRPSSQSLTLTSPEELREEDSKGALERKRKRNKRRRTRSERNLLAGKAVAATPSTSQTPVVAEGEEAVALDAEIDKVLEEKANKNNLSATNVKSIIRHVITNNMVQKMIMSSMKKKVENPDAAGGSSDDDGLVGPKMTRAKTKELLENQQMSLWPNVYSPVKIPKVPVSETHMLIQHDLPEDSSGDEEYVPKETDISEMLHSDDESSSVASHASDIGSPSPSVSKQRVATRRSLQICETPPPSGNDSLFKTPPPRPGIKKTGDESGISRRTRSKFPLKDTALEDLERQLVPPDITQDMYDWGTETDNEDYMAFLNAFLNPAKNQHDPNDMDDDADPEYNVMEEDEDLHDREELRRDRAVKVPKKELTQLIAELFEPGMLSGDDFEEDLSSLTGITPLVSDACTVDGNVADSSFPETPKTSQSKGCQFNTSNTSSVAGDIQVASGSKGGNANPVVYQVESVERAPAQNQDGANYAAQIIISSVPANEEGAPPTAGVPTGTGTITVLSTTASASITAIEEKVPLFREQDLSLLQHQMRQHIQLLTQSYVLTVSNENSSSKAIAKTAKAMVVELKGFARTNGERGVSNFAVCNLDSAVDVVNCWPHKFLQQSPIKKKILEEKYMSESGGVDNDEGKCGSGNHFPRHVVKIIAENPTFLYNNLLPETYSQVNAQARCTFTFSEDALVVRSMEELKDLKKSTMQLADVISSALLVVRQPKQIYHRIRNLRKSSTAQYCDASIKRYFVEGILPEIDRSVPEVVEEPLIQRSRDGLSSQWLRLLQHFEVSPTYKWEEKLSSDKSCHQPKRRQSNKQKTKDKPNENEPQPSTSAQLETINQVFPSGTYQIEHTDPNVHGFPVLDANGKAQVIFWVPKLAIHPAMADGPVLQGIPVGLCSPIQADQAGNEFKQPHQPREALEAGEMSQQENVQIQGASSTTVNLIGLNHLIRRSQRTPLKATPDDPSHNVPVPATPNTQLREGLGYHVVQPVGKPFDLNEVGFCFPAGKNGNDNIIDISTLQTPIKNRIFQKVTEAENEAQEEQESKEEQPDEDYDNDDDDDANSNVVLEGTEVELTEDEDEDTDPIVPSVGKPEVITLDSDEENDNEHVQPQLEDTKVVCRGGDGNDGKNNSNTNRDGNSSNSDPNPTNHGNGNEGSLTSTQSSTTRKAPSKPGKGDESDDENERKGGRKRSLPKDYDKDEVNSSKENGENNSPGKDKSNKRPTVIVNNPTSFSGTTQTQTQPKPVPSTSSHQPQSSCSNSKPQLNKKAKRSPGNPQTSSRRSSKYNVTPADKLLEDEPSGFDDVADAFMAAYLGKVQAATEKSNPGVYAAFVQTLMDAGEPVNQNELHAKVKVIFKDHPELLSEFESFLDPTLGEVNEPSIVAGSGSSSREETLAQIEFFQKIEKFTEKCPQLKSKVLNKIKSLREKPNLTEKDVASALEQFFAGNSVMMESFKALLPGVYRPHSTSNGMDFEEIDLDMEDPSKDTSSDDFHFEVVKLPEETTVPATLTCPCNCHVKTSDPAFSNRTKHCRKCSVKFQDGKVYIHNGRVMRPVSVELTPAASYNKQSVASSTSGTAASSSSRPTSSTVIHEARPRKDSHHSPHLPKSTEFKEPCNKQVDKKPHLSTTNTQHAQPVHPAANISKPSSHSKVATTHEPEETKQKLQHNNNHEEAPNKKQPMASGDSVVAQAPKQQPQTTSIPLTEEKEKVNRDWTPEEDTIILTACQQEPSLKLAWGKMAVLLPQRRIEQIQERCSELIRLIQQQQHE